MKQRQMFMAMYILPATRLRDAGRWGHIHIGVGFGVVRSTTRQSKL